MRNPPINPLTALFRSMLPLTVGQVLDHIDRSSESLAETASVIASADYGWVPPAAQAELIDWAEKEHRLYAATRFLARTEQADPLVACALWLRHLDTLPLGSAGERVKYLPSANHLRAALRQLLTALRPNANRHAADALLPPDHAQDRRTLAIIAADILDELRAWHAERSFDMHGDPRDVGTYEMLQLENDIDAMARDHRRLADLAQTAGALTPARDDAERERAVAQIRLTWGMVSSIVATDGHISVAQAARIAGKTTTTILRWLTAHPELGKKVGGRWDVDARALRTFVDRLPTAA